MLTRLDTFVTFRDLHVELLKPMLALGYFPALGRKAESVST